MSLDHLDRRTFLQRSTLAAAGFGAVADQLFTLRTLDAAVAQGDVDDYKALVCIFLAGGNDANNTIVPRGQSEHNHYRSVRKNLAIPRDALLPISPVSTDGREWGLHPSLPQLQQLFESGDAAVLGNVGTLVKPMSRQDYLSGVAKLPEFLFSHSDQSVQWHTSVPDHSSRTGWGGRLADTLRNANSGSVSMAMSLSGTNAFQVGNAVQPYRLKPQGSVSLAHYLHPDEGTPSRKHYRRSRTIDEILGISHKNVLEKSYAKLKAQSIVNDKVISEIVDDVELTTVFNGSNDLAEQLEMVAKLIASRERLGMCRQIFYCSVGGYDTHSEQLEPHAELLANLDEGLRQFYDATVELGVADSVTSFTASDFNRAYTSNGKGSDHGWGSHHLIVGGAVEGRQIYGAMPSLELGAPDDSGFGRWIPTTSIDQYAATLAKWFGADEDDVRIVVPNIGRFATDDLGIFG